MPTNVKQTPKGATLDMTGYKLIGDKLKDQILKDVKSTQTFAGIHLPDKIIITHDQFTSIEQDTTRIDEENGRIFVTPLNAMEVEIAR